MPAKQKPKAAPKTPAPRLAERAATYARRRPFLTWGTAAAIAGVIGVVPVVLPYLPRFQTVEAAELHAKEDAKRADEMAYGQARIETFVLRSQVNDCVTKMLKVSEKQICDGYRREYEQADKRMQTLYKQTVSGKAGK